MKVFVPRYRHIIPPNNPRLLNEMFLEIDLSDLRAVVKLWRDRDGAKDLTLEEYIKIDAEAVCKMPTRNNTLEPFLRRLHVSGNGGSSLGNKEVIPNAALEARKLGAGAARLGFSFRCGGGKTGLMRELEQGFLEELTNHRYPDQYAIQICPAWFMFRDENEKALTVINEGINTDSHVAIILPDFIIRRHFLNISSSGVVSAPGGDGTLDESTEVMCERKIGTHQTPLYMLDTYVAAFGHGYYHHTKGQIEDFITAGLEKAIARSYVNFESTSENILRSFEAHLDMVGLDPHIAYMEYLRENGKKPLHYGSMDPQVFALA